MAETRITIGNDEYAYCEVSDNAHEWYNLETKETRPFGELV